MSDHAPLKRLTAKMPAKQFSDKEMELRNGLWFKASGLVLDTNSSPEAKITGKVYSVAFIDPWGEVSCEWRDTDDVDVRPIDDDDALVLLDAMNRLWK